MTQLEQTAQRFLAEIARLESELAATESSRRDWAAEAMRLEMELEKFRTIALDEAAFWSVLLVGIGGENEDPPSNEQIERTVGLWRRHVAREMQRPDWHPRDTCGRGDACDQHGAYFRHADGSPCWGCQICLEEDGSADDGSGPVCAVHGEEIDG